MKEGRERSDGLAETRTAQEGARLDADMHDSEKRNGQPGQDGST